MKDPLVTSQSSLLPVLSAFSAPTTNATSHNPEAIREYAVATALVPELQRLSILCDTFGLIPSISETMVELYCSVVQLDSRVASISLLSTLPSFRILAQGLEASSKMLCPESLRN